MKKIYFWGIAILLLKVVIFTLSSFESAASDEMSGFFTKLPVSVLGRVGIMLPGNLVGVIHFLIRKAAHLFLFFMMGFCTANFVRNITKDKKKMFWIPLAWSSLYAATDEIHQYFVPGRSCSFGDWVLDTAGVLLGIGAVFLCMKYIKSGAER